MALNNELCLISAQSADYMGDFDEMSKYARDLLSAAPYNICPACFHDFGGGIEGNERFDYELLRLFIMTIEGRIDQDRFQEVAFELERTFTRR